MTGSVAIDVVIGLVFIYLLYSLFATVIMEIINSFLGLRARNLRYALRRMLMDEKVPKKAMAPGVADSESLIYRKRVGNLILKSPFKFINLFLKIFGVSSNLTHSRLFLAFYDQPSIKYLSGGGFANKPSYIAPRNFSKSLLDTLQMDAGKVQISIANCLKEIDENLEGITSGFDQLDISSEMKQDFEGQKAIAIVSGNGLEFEDWFRQLADVKKLQYAHLVLPQQSKQRDYVTWVLKCIDDYIVNTSQKKISLLEKIKDGIDALPKDSDTKKHLKSLLEEAQDDLEKFKFLLEQWFDDTMERARGWFKRRVQYFLFFIGFVLAVYLNGDTLQTIRKLSNDPKARAHLVDLAIEYSEELKTEQHASLSQKERDSVQESKEEGVLVNPKSGSSTTVDENERLRKANDSLRNVARELKKDITKAQNIISSNWLLPDSIEINKETIIPQDFNKHYYHLAIWDSTLTNNEWVIKIDSVKVSSILHESIDTAIFDKAIPPTSRAAYNTGEIDVDQNKYKWQYALSSRHIWGYILTALAISMGAPFWFDLLNRLIQLRNSVQPKKEDQHRENLTQVAP